MILKLGSNSNWFYTDLDFDHTYYKIPMAVDLPS